MVYPNKDSGAAIGEIISAIADKTGIGAVDVSMTSESLTVRIALAGAANGCARSSGRKGQTRPTSADKAKAVVKGKGQKKRHSRNIFKTTQVECDGKEMTVEKWARKLGMSLEGMKLRILKYGNPYGRKGPTDADKVAAGCAA